MFQKIIRACVKVVQRYLPEPFIFAIILTLVAALLAMPICRQTPIEVIEHWGNGVWGLLAFAMQMALVLVCGSTLASAPLIKRGISWLASLPKKPVGAIALVTAVVNTLLAVATLNATVSQQKMQMVQPELDKITRKYEGRDDENSKMRMAAEQQALLRKHNINPGSMLLLTFLQFPVIYLLHVSPLYQEHYFLK